MLKEKIQWVLDSWVAVNRIQHFFRKPENKDLLQLVKERTNFLSDKSWIGERIYCILNDIYTNVICSNEWCENHVPFLWVDVWYWKYCSRKCTGWDKNRLEKVKQTNLKNYGVEYVLQSPIIKDKVKKTNLKKYGVEYSSKSDIVKDKRNATNLIKYWFENSSKSDVVKEKLKKTLNNKYSKTVLSWYKNEWKKYNIDFYNENGIYYINCNRCWKITTEHRNFINSRLFAFHITPCIYCYKKYNATVSWNETTFYNFIKEIYNGNIEQSNRKILNWKEIDIFLPKESIWIEIHWLYWHSDEYKEKNDHYDKTKLCQEKWIQLFQFFEDEIPQAMMLMYSILANKWVLRDDIDINSINTTYWINIVNKDHLLVKYYARNTIINHIDSKDANEMLEMYHIQWKDISKYRYWLYDENNNLLSLMTFKKMSIDKNQKLSNWQNTYELSRYVTLPGVQIIWGFNKLINAFKKEVKESLIITYSNMRYSSELDNVYLRNWFQNLWFTGINYYYFFEWKKYHRFNFRKDNFYNNILPKYWIEVSSNYKEESESWMIKKLNSFKPIHKIYDCWNIKWILK